MQCFQPVNFDTAYYSPEIEKKNKIEHTKGRYKKYIAFKKMDEKTKKRIELIRKYNKNISESELRKKLYEIDGN